MFLDHERASRAQGKWLDRHLIEVDGVGRPCLEMTRRGPRHSNSIVVVAVDVVSAGTFPTHTARDVRKSYHR